MLNSIVVREMGAGWPVLQNRVSRFMEGVGATGVSLAEFEQECLDHVFIPHRPEVVDALRRKKLLFPVRDGLALRIFRTNPDSRRFEDPATTSKAIEFVRAAAALMIALTMVVEHAELAEGERRHREREGARRIGVLLRRHIDKGSSAVDIRRAMWVAYKPEPMKALARFVPSFDPARNAEPESLPAAVRRLPNNMHPHDRLLEVVRRAGLGGASLTQVRMRFAHPRPKSADLATTLKEAEEAGMILSVHAGSVKGGRPTTRYFHCDFGLPRVVRRNVVLPDNDDDQ